MNTPTRFVKFGFSIIFLLMTAGLVYADDAIYAQASIGQVSIDDFPGDFPIDDESTAFSAGLGYDFGNNIAIEASYVNWGDFSRGSALGNVKGEVDGGTLSGVMIGFASERVISGSRVVTRPGRRTQTPCCSSLMVCLRRSLQRSR